jgi:hypothetical protein
LPIELHGLSLNYNLGIPLSMAIITKGNFPRVKLIEITELTAVIETFKPAFLDIYSG